MVTKDDRMTTVAYRYITKAIGLFHTVKSSVLYKTPESTAKMPPKFNFNHGMFTGFKLKTKEVFYLHTCADFHFTVMPSLTALLKTLLLKPFQWYEDS